MYCETNEINALTAENARSFVSDQYGAALGDKDASHNVNRAMHLLLDYQSFGMVFKQSHATLKRFSPNYVDLFEGFLEYLRSRGTAEKSIATWRNRLFRLEHFLISHGLERFGQIELHHVNSYVESLACYSSGTICATFNILGRLFDYAHENGYHEHTFSDSLPRVRRSKRHRLPTAFSPEEVEAILATVDRGNPIGKRNYAMLMLAAKLGLRIGDMCRLTFDSLDWNAKRISIVQHKTGNPLELPLLDDVGWAVIDYPVIPKAPGSHQPYIFSEDEIRRLLGHSDLTTTEIYAQISTEKARKVLESTDPTVKTETEQVQQSWTEDTDLMSWLAGFQA